MYSQNLLCFFILGDLVIIIDTINKSKLHDWEHRINMSLNGLLVKLRNNVTCILLDFWKKTRGIIY